MVSLGVALIVYGRYKFLDEAVRSIASQTRSPDEVAVFTDNKEVVRDVLIKYDVKAEIYQEPYLSLPATYARIGEVSETEYVLPLEDDDVFKPNKLEAIEKYCIGYPLIKHAAEFIDEESRPINIADRQPRSQLVITRENAWLQHLSYSYHIWPSTFAIRTSLLRKYKDILFKLKLHADFAIFSLALLEGNILYVPERLTYYRIGSGHSQLTSCEKLPKLVCTWNKYSYDDFFLYKNINEKHIRKLILRTYLLHLLRVYILNNIYDCQFKYNVSYPHLLSISIKYVVNYFPHLFTDLLKKVGLVVLLPFLGRTKTSNFYKNRICRELANKVRYRQSKP